MSRTYRYRHAAPKGCEVRDGGEVFWPACCPNKYAQHASWVLLYPLRCRCNQWWATRGWAGHHYHKEKKENRKAHYRQYKAKVKDRMRHEDWESIPRYNRTEGHQTW